MTFDTPAGSRGARQPRAGLLRRWVNKTAAGRIRRSGKMMGFNALILTTVGAKSGAERTNPVGWFPGKDDSWLIVASAAGAAGNPAWYHNIAAHPGKVRIEVNGQTIPRHGRAAAWGGAGPGIAADQRLRARFAQYQRKTDRELPVIRLVRQSG